MKRYIAVVLTALFALQPAAAVAAPWYSQEQITDFACNTVVPHVQEYAPWYVLLTVAPIVVLLSYNNDAVNTTGHEEASETLQQKLQRKEFERLVERAEALVAQEQQNQDGQNASHNTYDNQATQEADENYFDQCMAQAYEAHNNFC